MKSYLGTTEGSSILIAACPKEILFLLSQRLSIETDIRNDEQIRSSIRNLMRHAMADGPKGLTSIICGVPLVHFQAELILLKLSSSILLLVTRGVDIKTWRKLLWNTNSPMLLQLIYFKLDESSSILDKATVTSLLTKCSEVKELSEEDLESLRLTPLPDWFLRLRHIFVVNRLSSIWTPNKQDKSFRTALYYLYSVMNGNEEQTVELLGLLDRLSKQQESFTEEWIVQLFYGLYRGHWSILSDLDKVCNNSDLHVGLRSLEQISQIIQRDSQSTSFTQESLLDIFSFVDSWKKLKISSLVGNEENLESISKDWNKIIIWVGKFKESVAGIGSKGDKTEGPKKNFKAALAEGAALVDYVIRAKLGFGLRDTQRVAIAAALLCPSERNLVSQVK
jgi:hypothetical protein